MHVEKFQSFYQCQFHSMHFLGAKTALHATTAIVSQFYGGSVGDCRLNTDLPGSISGFVDQPCGFIRALAPRGVEETSPCIASTRVSLIRGRNAFTVLGVL